MDITVLHTYQVNYFIINSMTLIQGDGVAVSPWMWTRKTLSMTILSSQGILSPYVLYFIFCLCHCMAVFVGPCHHGMARPQVADGGTASDMEGSCE